MGTRIDGKVARVLNEFQLVLNVGTEHGVTPETRFVIYEEGEEISDPDTGASLGCVELVKGEMVVHHVQPTMCVVMMPRETDETTVLSARLATRSYTVGDPSATHEKLPVSKRDATGKLPAERRISVGDLARDVTQPADD